MAIRMICMVLICCNFGLSTNAQINLPAWSKTANRVRSGDWLVHPVLAKAQVYKANGGKDIVLDNGLVQRRFRLHPNLACTGYKNKTTGQQLLRAIKAEARIKIDGVSYNIGGLYGQMQQAYLLPDRIDSYTKSDSDFIFKRCSVAALPPYLNPKSSFWATNKKAATGKMLNLVFQSKLPAMKGISVTVHYDLYDGIPLITKWISIDNHSKKSVRLNQVVSEILGMVEEQSAVVGTPSQMQKPSGLYIETNYAFNNAMRYDLSDQTTHWKADKSYTSQVNYDYNTPCLLEVYPDQGPGIDLEPSEQFKSVRTYELAMDSYDRQRRGMEVQQMYRVIAPWTTANPIFMHLISKTDQEVYQAIDQCVATGYEALILSFGSHIKADSSYKCTKCI